MKILRTLLVGLFAITSFGIASAQDETATLKIRFKYKGKAPARKPMGVPAFPGLLDESLIVNSKNNGIQNVVVFVKTGRRGSKLPPQKPSNKVFPLDCNNGRFDPHIVLVRVGETIKLTNRDPVGYNVNFGGFVHDDNLALPTGRIETLGLRGAEPTVIPISCNIHPWMKAHMLVVDHPFAGVSNEDGMLEIKGLPSGTKLVLQAWHETGTFKEKILIKGEETKWSRNRIELELKPGVHDMGTVEVPADQFEL